MTDDLKLTEARIDELLQLLAVLNAGDDGRAHVKARLDALYPPEYKAYCDRRRNTPGDHAPGRMLDFRRWQILQAELTHQIAKGPQKGENHRIIVLKRALLLDSVDI